MSSQTPPGWYPDGSGRLRYWDGAAWTEHFAPVAPPAAPAAPAAPVNAPTQFTPPAPAQFSAPAPFAASAARQNWFLRHKIVSSVAGIFVLIVVVSAVAGGGGDKKPVSALADTSDATSASPAADASASAKAPAPSKAASPKAAPKVKATPKPSVQARFLDAVEDGMKAGDSDNEIKVVQARKKRGAAMCSILPSSLQVANWKGTVKEVSTELGGDKGILSIELTDDIGVSTWNNSLSDLDAKTLIPTGSPMYDALGDLEEGDKVLFSGSFVRESSNCISEQSLIDANGMATPTFTFKFSSFKKD